MSITISPLILITSENVVTTGYAIAIASIEAIIKVTVATVIRIAEGIVATESKSRIAVQFRQTARSERIVALAGERSLKIREANAATEIVKIRGELIAQWWAKKWIRREICAQSTCETSLQCRGVRVRQRRCYKYENLITSYVSSETLWKEMHLLLTNLVLK